MQYQKKKNYQEFIHQVRTKLIYLKISNYGISNFNSEIISKSNRNEMIKLEIRFSDFVIKGFPPGKVKL